MIDLKIYRRWNQLPRRLRFHIEPGVWTDADLDLREEMLITAKSALGAAKEHGTPYLPEDVGVPAEWKLIDQCTSVSYLPLETQELLDLSPGLPAWAGDWERGPDTYTTSYGVNGVKLFYDFTDDLVVVIIPRVGQALYDRRVA